MDTDGYPDKAELNKIADYDMWMDKDSFRYRDLLEYVYERWTYGYPYWQQNGDIYEISTGGWSGNESLIAAMQKNVVFWSQCWVSSRRGGHYIFEIPPIKQRVDNAGDTA